MTVPAWPLLISASDTAAFASESGRCRLGPFCSSSGAATPLSFATPQNAPALDALAPAPGPSASAPWLVAGCASSSSDRVKSTIFCAAAHLLCRASLRSPGADPDAPLGLEVAAGAPERHGAGVDMSSTMMASSAERNSPRWLQGHHTLSRARRSAAAAVACMSCRHSKLALLMPAAHT